MYLRVEVSNEHERNFIYFLRDHTIYEVSRINQSNVFEIHYSHAEYEDIEHAELLSTYSEIISFIRTYLRVTISVEIVE